MVLKPCNIFCASCPPPRGLGRWQWPGTAVDFLFVVRKQLVQTFVVIPERLTTHIVQQVRSVYPEAVVVKDDRTVSTALAQTPIKAIGSLSGSFAAPLHVVSSPDPLVGILTSLSSLDPEEIAILRLRVRRAPTNWQRVVTERLARVQKTPSAQQSQKLQEVGYQVQLSLHLGMSVSRAEACTAALSSAMQALTSAETGWRLKRGSWAAPWETLSVTEVAHLFHIPYQGVAAVKNIAWGGAMTGEAPEGLPLADGSANTIPIGRTLFRHEQKVFGIAADDRRRHTYVIGKSGAGKSTLLANMIIHDLKHDHGAAVIDPHGDLIDTILDFIPKHRLQDVIVFDPSDPAGVPQLSLFSGENTAQQELIVSGIMSVFHKLYGHSWGPRLEYFLRNGLFTLLDRHANLSDVLRLYSDRAFREEVLRNVHDPALLRFWHDEFDALPSKLMQESISPILNKVGQFVTSPLIRRVVDVRHSSFSLDEVLGGRRILLVNVSQGKLGEDNATLLGAMIITKLQLAAMNRAHLSEEARQDFYLYIDEFQNFATESFMKILSEARKYRLNLTLANQYIAQLPDAVRTAIFGNAGTLISFLTGAEDAQWLAREYGNLYKPEELIALGRYEMVVKMLVHGEAQAAFPATSLPLAKSRNQNREKVLRISRERYGR